MPEMTAIDNSCRMLIRMQAEQRALKDMKSLSRRIVESAARGRQSQLQINAIWMRRRGSAALNSSLGAVLHHQ